MFYSQLLLAVSPIINLVGVNIEKSTLIVDNINDSLVNNSINDSKNIETEVRNIMAIYGYYTPNITVSIKNKQTYVNIKANKPVVIEQININLIDSNQYHDGAVKAKSELTSIINDYKSNIHKPLNQLEYQDFKDKLIQSAHNNGYLDAELVVHKIQINKTVLTANINIELRLNNLYYLNIINVESLQQIDPTKETNKLNTNFLYKFLPYDYNKLSETQVIIINAPYISNEILEFKNSLSRYYSDIKLNTKIDKTNHKVNITLKIKPIKNYRYSVGLGYSTDEGARAFGGLQIRNITYQSHKLDLQAKLAQYREVAEANYILPGLNPATDIATVGYQFRSDKKRNNNNLEKERHQVISQYQKSLLNGNMFLTGGLSYRYEEYRDIENQKSRKSELFVPYFIYDHVLSDNRINTYKGLHINALLEGANDAVLSDSSFLRLHTKFKGIYPLVVPEYIDGLRIIVRSQFGQVWHKEQHKIPPTLRFYAGGTETVRGYRYESLGPREINAKRKPIIVGGDRLISFSGELEKTIYKNWSAAAFYDIGNAYDTWSNWRQNIQRGIGAGVRWRSPLGPVRFDIAQAIDKNDKPWRIDFNIGPDL